MAVEFMEGFDTMNTSQLNRRSWFTFSNSAGCSIVSGAGSYVPSVGALQVTSVYYGNEATLTIPLTARPEYYIGFDNLTGVVGGGYLSNLFYIQDTTGATICSFNAGSGGCIATNYGNSTTGPFLSSGVWANIQIHFVASPTAGVLQVKVNGTMVLNLSGLNTGTNNIGYILLTGTRQEYDGSYNIYDNLWVMNTLGSHSNSFPVGKMLIQPLMPDSDGSYEQWTPSTAGSNYAQVNQLPADDDTTYNYDAMPGDIDAYNIQPIDMAITAIHAVQVGAVVRKEVVISKLLDLVAVSGSTIVLGPDVDVPTSYTSTTMLLPDNPDTGLQWDEIGVGALQIGIKTRNLYADKNQPGVSRIRITTPTYVQGTGGFSPWGSTGGTFPGNVTAGNTVFVLVSDIYNTGGVGTVADSQSNVYQRAGFVSAGGSTLTLYSTTITTTGTLTFTGSDNIGSDFCICIGIEMTGALGTPYTSFTSASSTTNSVSLSLPYPYNSFVIFASSNAPQNAYSNGSATLAYNQIQTGSGGSVALGFQAVNTASPTISLNVVPGYGHITSLAVAFPN